MIVNDLLCLLVRRLNVTEHVVLRGLLTAYYSLSDISVAKKELLKCTFNMKFDRPFPRYPDRQDPGRNDKEINDIIDILKELDERSCLSQLPRFVTDNIDKIPTVQYNEGDLRFLLKKMDKMESTIQSLQESVYAILARTGELVDSGVSQAQARPRPGSRPMFSGRCIAR